jgi:hypothetical protein
MSSRILRLRSFRIVPWHDQKPALNPRLAPLHCSSTTTANSYLDLLTMLRLEFCSLVFLAAASIRPAQGACFFRNGTQTTSDYAPCSLDPTAALSTVCCASWDTCLPNGLCQSSIDKLFWRETCTKQNWDDGGCQELCSKDVRLRGCCVLRPMRTND